MAHAGQSSPVLPMVAQRALVGGLAAIGRRRGYRSEYPELLG